MNAGHPNGETTTNGLRRYHRSGFWVIVALVGGPFGAALAFYSLSVVTKWEVIAENVPVLLILFFSWFFLVVGAILAAFFVVGESVV